MEGLAEPFVSVGRPILLNHVQKVEHFRGHNHTHMYIYIHKHKR
jgi:hypothetical protein